MAKTSSRTARLSLRVLLGWVEWSESGSSTATPLQTRGEEAKRNKKQKGTVLNQASVIKTVKDRD